MPGPGEGHADAPPPRAGEASSGLAPHPLYPHFLLLSMLRRMLPPEAARHALEIVKLRTRVHASQEKIGIAEGSESRRRQNVRVHGAEQTA